MPKTNRFDVVSHLVQLMESLQARLDRGKPGTKDKVNSGHWKAAVGHHTSTFVKKNPGQIWTNDLPKMLDTAWNSQFNAI